MANLDKSKLSSDGGDGVASCHGSVLVGEDGQAGDRLIPERVSVGTCQPHRFDGDGVVQTHALLCVVSLTTRPHDLAGADLGCHGENHRCLSVMGSVYRVRGSATIPAGGLPTVTLHAAAIIIVCIHQVVMLQILTPLPEGGTPLGEGQVVQVVGHGSFRLIDLSLQGRVSASLPEWSPSLLSHGQGSERGRTRCRESERT